MTDLPIKVQAEQLTKSKSDFGKSGFALFKLTALLIAIFVCACVFRFVIVFTPAISERNIRPYARCMNYAIAAKNIRGGHGCTIGVEQKKQAYADFKKSESMIPDHPESIVELANDQTHGPFVDEIGYLLLTLGLANVSGEVSYYNAIYLQIFLSSIFAVLACAITFQLSRSLVFAGLIGVAIAFNPLEAMVSVLPDLPIWAWYATIASFAVGYVAVRAKVNPKLTDWGVCILLGLLVGFCVSVRLLSLVFPVTLLMYALLRFRFFSKTRVTVFLVAVVVSIVSVKSFDFGVPTVGRSAFWHTLLGGMSEFGDIEGLEWKDGVIDNYIQQRHGDLEPLTPEYSAAAKKQYWQELSDRPKLPVQVFLQRVGNFLVAYRPTKNGLPLVVAFAMLKIFALAGFVAAYRRLGQHGRILLTFAALLGLANLFSHALIVPLLEVYILPILITLCLLATMAILWFFPSKQDKDTVINA